MNLIPVFKTLAPFIAHVTVRNLLIREGTNAFLLLLIVHLTLVLRPLLSLLTVLVHLRSHLIVVLLLLLRLVETLSVLLSLILSILGVLHLSFHLIEGLLGLLIVLNASQALLVLPLAKLICHHLPLLLLSLLVHPIGSFMLGLQHSGPFIIIAVFVLGIVFLLSIADSLNLLFFSLGWVFHAKSSSF